MVKLFKVPGKNNRVHFPGTCLIGDRVYDNDVLRIAEKLIPKMWWVDSKEEVKEPEKVVKEQGVVKEPEKVDEPDKVVEEPEKVAEKSEVTDTPKVEGDPKLVEEPGKVAEPESKESEGSEVKDKEVDVKASEALKENLKSSYTVLELKAKAKELGLKGYSVMNEDKLAQLLVDNGVKS